MYSLNSSGLKKHLYSTFKCVKSPVQISVTLKRMFRVKCLKRLRDFHTLRSVFTSEPVHPSPTVLDVASWIFISSCFIDSYSAHRSWRSVCLAWRFTYHEWTPGEAVVNPASTQISNAKWVSMQSSGTLFISHLRWLKGKNAEPELKKDEAPSPSTVNFC